MPYGLYLSASGANAQSHRLEVLSHNLANVNTPGFKPHLAMVKSRHAEAVERGDVPMGSGGVDDMGGGVLVQPSVTQFSQGPIRGTGSRTDFAINDTRSFFVVQRGDQKLLTRAGSFQFDATGRLKTPIGEQVLATTGQPVVIDPQLPFEVQDDGTIVQAGQRQSLMLARPKELGDLSRIGDNLYQSLSAFNPVPDAERAVLPGSLEESAVKPTSAMMELIEASRVYEANVRMIQTQDQSIGSLISRVLGD
jgi:flagellar basal body rod protein FlgG